jgi:3',5'-cyclic AMP phosphodiesterase CpdA
MRNFILFLGLALLIACAPAPPAVTVNFIVASDMGRRGVSEQQNIAKLMARQVETAKIDFIAVAGDPIHDLGVTSVDDQEWQLKFEQVYSAESLQKMPFYIASGNHEYRGSVQAIIDYSQKSERWNAPARYFSIERPIESDEQTALFVFIDTTPLIDRYRTEEGYSDVREQSIERQLYWLDSTLFTSTGHWKFVIGHHPVYADTDKPEGERTDMLARVGQILEKRKVDFYISGHIHNFQYISHLGGNVNYIVNSSASSSREVKPIDGTVFCNGDPGFSVFSVSSESVIFSFVNHTGDVVYRRTVTKQ